MILSAHQPAYLPWLGYLHKIAICDIFVILDDVQFEKNSFTNRNKIKTPQGEHWLTIPVQNKSHLEKVISQLEIDNKTSWRDKHRKTISQIYKKAPFYKEFADWLEKIYSQEWTNLVDLTEQMNDHFLKQIGITTKLIRQSELNCSKKKQELILELCEKTKADIYISGSLGKNYIDPQYFTDHGIRIYFQEYHHPAYPQLYGEFLPYMSCLDLLMNVGEKQALEIIFEGNDRTV
ncbi:MAG: WbqC family protein [Planctomycetaceae bacterium]|jgi:hypothetical protein|nr:WbqC family protein [Planctomycetaceae bacterium]